MDCTEPKSREFLKFCSDNGCVQLVNNPTRLNNFLDLVLTNDPLIVSSVMVDVPFSTSDHNSITLSIITPTNDDSNHSTSVGCVDNMADYDYCNADWVGFNSYCTYVNCSVFFANCCCANDYWLGFSNWLNFGISHFVPRKSGKNL